MDKRWIFILIIIVIACACGYLIVNSSTTVGSAIADVSKSTVTLPHSYSVKDSTNEDIIITNKKNMHEEIYIKDIGKEDFALKEFKADFKKLSSDGSVDELKNTSNTTEDYKLYNAYYKNGSDYMSVSYLYKNEHTYLIKATGYSDIDNLIEKVNFVADTIKPDYKKSQD